MQSRAILKIATAIILLVLASSWWQLTAPPAHIVIADSIVFDGRTAQAMASVDKSTQFADTLQHFPSEISGQDDIVFLAGGKTALVSAMDGRIWKLDLATHAVEPFVDPPLMPSGMHEAPGDHDHVYFCASHLHGQSYAPDEVVGLYRLNVITRRVEPMVLRVPDTTIDRAHPVVYADADSTAPELARASAQGRPLAFCNDLEITEDGRRIYFSEPFSYQGAAMGGGTIQEAVSLGGNGRLWRHDLDTGTTRLIAEGYHFVDGLLYDLHPGLAREQSMIVSQTPLFRLARFWLAGPKAGTAEVVLDGITGMPDGLDRDAQGNIWTGLIKERSGLLTWLHANAWIKPLFLRLPLQHVPQARRTGVLALSPDGATPLYYASYEGPLVSNIASVIPGPGGIYLNYFDPALNGMVRLAYPASLKRETH